MFGMTSARIFDHGTFRTMTVDSPIGGVTFFFDDAADVQSIADAFNAVLSPKANEATDAE
jgi:hypothetical protein